MTDDEHSALDISLWKKSFRHLDPIFLKSIIRMISCYWQFDSGDHTYYKINGYVMSTYDRSYVYGESICNWIGLEHDENEARDITHLLDGEKIKDVAYGWDFVAILTRDGCVYLASDSDSGWKTDNKLKQINGPSDRYEKIACGDHHMLLIRTDKRLMARGKNNCGQLTGHYDSYLEMRDTGLSDVVHISCGGGHSMAMTSQGKLYVWGWNNNGQLGLNDRSDRNSPILLQIDGQIKEFIANYWQSLVLMQDGTLYGFGINNLKQLGFESPSQILIPTRLPIENVVSIEGGCQYSYYYTIALTKSNEIYVSGKIFLPEDQFSKFTKIGTGNFTSTISVYTPEPVSFGWRVTTRFLENP